MEKESLFFSFGETGHSPSVGCDGPLGYDMPCAVPEGYAVPYPRGTLRRTRGVRWRHPHCDGCKILERNVKMVVRLRIVIMYFTFVKSDFANALIPHFFLMFVFCYKSIV